MLSMSSANVGPNLIGLYDKSNHQKMLCKACLLKMLVKLFKNTYEVFLFGTVAGCMPAN